MRVSHAALVVIEDMPAGLTGVAEALVRHHMAPYDRLQVIVEKGSARGKEFKAAYEELSTKMDAVDVYLLTSWDYVYQLRLGWHKGKKPRLLYLATATPGRAASTTIHHRVGGKDWEGAWVPVFLTAFLPMWTSGAPLDEAVEHANVFSERATAAFLPRLTQVAQQIATQRGLDWHELSATYGRALKPDEQEIAQMIVDTQAKVRGATSTTMRTAGPQG